MSCCIRTHFAIFFELTLAIKLAERKKAHRRLLRPSFVRRLDGCS
jgi:hypothetical protein